MSVHDPHFEPPRGCDGLAAPYVLGALSEQECGAFRVHLKTCAVCREEVAALQLVADALPAAAPQLLAPDELKINLMRTVEQEARTDGAAQPARASKRRSLRSLSWQPAFGFAALVIAAIALLPGGGSSSAPRVIRAQVLAPKASALLRLSGGHAQLDVSGMPQTAPNRVYEVWIKRAGAPQPTDALFTVTAAGRATVAVPGNVKGVKQVLVTAEPLGGSPAPTSTPVIVASVS